MSEEPQAPEYREVRSLALAYVRVSTQEQAERGLSLDAQRAALQRLAALRSFTLAGIYEDAGISGTTLERPGLQALLARVSGNNTGGERG